MPGVVERFDFRTEQAEGGGRSHPLGFDAEEEMGRCAGQAGFGASRSGGDLDKLSLEIQVGPQILLALLPLPLSEDCASIGRLVED